MPFPKLKIGTSNQSMRRTERVTKIRTKHLTLGVDHTHKIFSRVKNLTITALEAHLKAIRKKLGDRKQIETQRANKSNMLKNKAITNLNGTF